MNSPTENVSIDRVRVNHVPQKTPVTRARRKRPPKIVTFHVVVRSIYERFNCPIELVRRPSLFPTFSHRRPRRTVPSEPTSVRYLTRDNAPGSPVLCTVPDRRIRHGCP